MFVRRFSFGVVVFLLAGFTAYGQSAPPALDIETLHPLPDGIVYPSTPTGMVSAKFICGTSTLGELAPGRYFTALNLANTAREGAQPLILEMRLIRTNGSPAVIGPFALGELPGLRGLEIDCARIASHFNADLSTQLVKGFIRVSVADRNYSAPIGDQLDAVAVYTATARSGRP